VLCVTGREPSADELQRRLNETDAQLGGCLQEVRIDALRSVDSGLWRLVEARAESIIACCRAGRQGGLWQGSEGDRLNVLERCARIGVAYVDVESDCSGAWVDSLRRGGRCKILVSHHEPSTAAGDWSAALQRMQALGPDVMKLAVAVDDAADLLRLMDIGKAAGEHAFVLGMGPAGILSRMRYSSFGAPWTYVAAHKGGETAPGQLSVVEALAAGLPGSASVSFLALVGGPQVMHSPGPPTYHGAFRARHRSLMYVPVITQRLRDTLELLRRLGAIGASITMPHKRAAWEASERDPLAQQVGAANTVRFAGQHTLCTNTDVIGVKGPLCAAMSERRAATGKPVDGKVLILGAGGAARAARAACEALSLHVTVAARDPRAAHAAMGGSVTVVPFDERANQQASILIRATPPEPDGPQAWPRDAALRKDIVFDMTLAAAPTALLKRARQQGALTVDGEQMWLAQGAEQLRWLLDLDIDAADLKERFAWP
jgi:3-dehydroquinate dehydratase type I